MRRRNEEIDSLAACKEELECRLKQQTESEGEEQGRAKQQTHVLEEEKEVLLKSLEEATEGLLAFA